MSRLHLCFGFTLTFAIGLLLRPALAGWGQPPPAASAPAGGEPGEKLPSSIRQAYDEAEKFGEPPAEQKKAPVSPARSLWFDGVHYVGLSGALLLLASLGTGLWIYLVVAFRRGQDRVLVRRRWRQWHYGLGFAAGALALSHATGRLLQGAPFGFSVPVVTGAVVVLLVVSGLVRAWSPRSLAWRPGWWRWSHRALTALAVVMLFWHGITMYVQLVLHK